MTQDVYAYLTELAENNNKAWFEANKTRFEALKSEFELAIRGCMEALNPLMDLQGVEPRKCIFRIYRDVRFSKDKAPYKKNFSASINERGEKETLHFVYIHVQPGESFLGMGLYQPTPAQLKAIRQEIDYNPETILSVINAPAFVKSFKTLAGDSLKTAPKGYGADHPQIELLRRTQFFVTHPLSEKTVLAGGFGKYVKERYEEAQPLLAYLASAIGQAGKED